MTFKNINRTLWLLRRRLVKSRLFDKNVSIVIRNNEDAKCPDDQLSLVVDDFHNISLTPDDNYKTPIRLADEIATLLIKLPAVGDTAIVYGEEGVRGYIGTVVEAFKGTDGSYLRLERGGRTRVFLEKDVDMYTVNGNRKRKNKTSC